MSVDDLAKAMKSALDDSGDLICLRAQLEEELVEAFHQMRTDSGENSSQYSFSARKCKPAMPPEIILANNLIYQYLHHVGLKRTTEVLCSESGIPNKPVPDHILRSSLPGSKKSREISAKPILCSIAGEVTEPTVVDRPGEEEKK